MSSLLQVISNHKRIHFNLLTVILIGEIMKIVNITGFNSSGASAVRDYLAEFDITEVFPNEFKLFRVKDGIFDLYKSLFEMQLFPIERAIAITNFSKTMRNLEDRIYTLTKFGIKKGNFLPVDFQFKLRSFVENIKESEYYGHSFHFEMEKPYLLFRIESNFIRIQNLVKKLFSCYKIERKFQQQIGVYTNSIHKFNEALNHFIEGVFTDKGKIKVLLDAAPPNYYSISKLNILFPDSKTIVLVRDPRDVFFTAMIKNQTWFIGDITRINNDHVSNFILNYKTNIQSLELLEENNDVLVLHFEDLVFNYEYETNRINRFLNLNNLNIKNRYKYFNPIDSMKTVGIYKNWKNKDDIARIENSLNKIYSHLIRYT